MRIAFVHPSSPSTEGTGSTHSATLILEALRSRGHDVVTYCLSEPEHRYGEYEYIEPTGFPPHTETQRNRALKSVMGELADFDLVHSYHPSIPALNELSERTTTVVSLNAYSAICPKMDLRYMAKRNCGSNGLLKCTACSVATSGGSAEHGPLYRSISRLGNLRLIRQVPPEDLQIDGFHALSSHVKRKHVEFGYPKDRIEVVPNILDERFLVDHQSDFEEPYRLLHVGYLRDHKGVLLLPDVMDLLVNEFGADFEMTIVGTGGLRDRLARDINRLDLADVVELRGHVPYGELPQVYAHHDIFVYPGQWDEPFGRVFLESLAAGTPVVGTDVGSIGEIIDDAGTVTRASAGALADAIRTAVANCQLTEWSANATERAKDFRQEKLAPRFESFYDQVRA